LVITYDLWVARFAAVGAGVVSGELIAAGPLFFEAKGRGKLRDRGQCVKGEAAN
jgi:hypothetical protein